MTRKKTKTSDIERIAAFKCVRANGTDFRTGTINYLAALERGEAVEVLDAAPATGHVCGHGLHVSPTARKTIQFASRDWRPWRYLEGHVLRDDIIEQDEQKMRVRRFTPTREIGLADIFGADFGARVPAAHADMATWESIPWLRPSGRVTNKQVADLIGSWRDALAPWSHGATLPSKIKIVKTTAAAADAAAAAAADAAAADAAAAAAADAAAAAAAGGYRFCRWYVRPYYVLRRSFRWRIFMDDPSPFAPLIDLYRMGCLPIGFVDDTFVVYVPTQKGTRP